MKRGFLFLLLIVSLVPILRIVNHVKGNEATEYLDTFHRGFETVEEYWSFGEISQLKFHLKIGDRYLTKAQESFREKKYNEAIRDLERSDDHFAHAILVDREIINSDKDSSQIHELLINQADTQIEI